MKNSKSKLPSFAVMIVALAIPATLYVLKTENLDFRFSAADSEIPQHVEVSDVNHDSVVVSWITEKEVVGGINLNEAGKAPYVEDEARRYHAITVNALELGASYQFSVVSDGTEYLNDTSYYSLQTANYELSPESNMYVYGQVFGLDGITFQQYGLAYFELERNGVKSQKIVATINEAGGYQLNLNNLKDETYRNHFSYRGESDIVLTIQINGQLPISRKYTVNLDYSKQLPNIYLGDIDVEFMPGIDGL